MRRGFTESEFNAGVVTVVILLFSLMLTLAEPPKLVVRPQGTNQLQLTGTFLQTNVFYTVMVRSNSSDAHWVILTSILGSTNSTASVIYNLSEANQLKELKSLTIANLRSWTFVVGSGEDSDGNGLPDVYEELALRSDPYLGADPYGDADQDGWVNLQEMQNSTNPLMWDEPPRPQGLDIRYYTNNTVVVTWRNVGGPHVDYFLIEKAQRTVLLDPDHTPIIEPGKPVNKQEILAYWARMRRLNRPPARSFSRDQVEHCITNAYQLAARIPALPGLTDYKYVATNVNVTPLSKPLFRIRAHYTPSFRAYLDKVATKEILKTILQVVAHPGTNGYDLTAVRPIPYAWYLLLVRDKVNPKWRASGFFMAGTNQNPVSVWVDSKGMMHGGQSPIAMPEVRFLPDVVAPEFTAGWGEDSDGDGLPDFYEVLVTQTDPTAADTGHTGILDGYKEVARDGWSNLEKFRRRVNPQKAQPPPPALDLQKPTLAEFWRALTPETLGTDLHYELVVAIRKQGETIFKPLDQELRLFDYAHKLRDPRNDRMDFDVRIVWRPPQPRPQSTGYSGP